MNRISRVDMLTVEGTQSHGQLIQSRQGQAFIFNALKTSRRFQKYFVGAVDDDFGYAFGVQIHVQTGFLHQIADSCVCLDKAHNFFLQKEMACQSRQAV